MRFDLPPGRPYGLHNEARRILHSVGAHAMPDIGGKRLAGSLVEEIRGTVSREMSKARGVIGDALNELADEIRHGSEMVASVVRQEARGVRDEFGDIVGNAHEAAEEAVQVAKQAVATVAATVAAEAPQEAANPPQPAPVAEPAQEPAPVETAPATAAEPPPAPEGEG